LDGRADVELKCESFAMREEAFNMDSDFFLEEFFLRMIYGLKWPAVLPTSK
jgi:hypothetical protein